MGKEVHRTGGPKVRDTGRPNRREVLVVAAYAGPLVRTTDPSDRAHGVVDSAGYIVPAATPGGRPNPRVRGATPRAYPPSQMAGDIANDSAFDEWERRRRRLEEEEIILAPPAAAAARERAMAVLQSRGGRDPRNGLMVLKGTICVQMTPREKALERAGTNILKRAREARRVV